MTREFVEEVKLDAPKLIEQWWRIMQQIENYEPLLAPLVAEEKKLRLLIAEALWANEEGTKYLDLGAGYRLRGTLKIDRKVDETAIDAVIGELQKQNISTAGLLRTKRELVTKIYRELTAEQRLLLDQALVIKPASPQLKLVAPGDPNES